MAWPLSSSTFTHYARGKTFKCTSSNAEPCSMCALVDKAKRDAASQSKTKDYKLKPELDWWK